MTAWNDGRPSILLVPNRYPGYSHQRGYSAGQWIAAVAENDTLVATIALAEEIDDGPNGQDAEAMHFWDQGRKHIATGATPQEALDTLLAKLQANG